MALTGGRGNGKTQLAVEAMRMVTRAGGPVLFSTAISFFAEVKSTFSRESEFTEKQVADKYRRPRLLVVDEVGKRGGSDWENNLLFDVLNSRYNDIKDTILIDNRSPKEFEEWIGPSVASRMSEGGGIIECNWGSFR